MDIEAERIFQDGLGGRCRSEVGRVGSSHGQAPTRCGERYQSTQGHHCSARRSIPTIILAFD
jgi:hypothetical protein